MGRRPRANPNHEIYSAAFVEGRIFIRNQRTNDARLTESRDSRRAFVLRGKKGFDYIAIRKYILASIGVKSTKCSRVYSLPHCVTYYILVNYNDRYALFNSSSSTSLSTFLSLCSNLSSTPSVHK